jgi:hypothetical protein
MRRIVVVLASVAALAAIAAPVGTADTAGVSALQHLCEGSGNFFSESGGGYVCALGFGRTTAFGPGWVAICENVLGYTGYPGQPGGTPPYTYQHNATCLPSA